MEIIEGELVTREEYEKNIYKTGRPRANSPKELYDKFIAFLEKQEKNKKPITKRQFLAYINQGPSYLKELKTKSQFSSTLKMIDIACLAWQEEQLFTGKNQVGTIFALKNNYSQYFKDRKETHTTHEIKNDLKSISHNELDELQSLENHEDVEEN